MIQRTIVLQLALAQYLFHKINKNVSYINKRKPR